MKVVALTKTKVDPALKGLRYAKLAASGIIFKDDLQGLPDGQSYTYACGIVETEAEFKGLVLEEVLSHLSYRPSFIVFVDNSQAKVDSVESSCRKIGIPCLSFVYKPQRNESPLDEKIADYQLRVLVTEHRWVSDSEARSLLEP